MGAPVFGDRRLSAHPFAIGLFSFNVAGGLTQTKQEIWDASWINNVTVARLAEEAGLDFLLPLGRWRGPRDYPVETEDEGGSFETLTWASGLLAVTERIAIFGTLHVGYVNPMFAAKQVVTAHHIGRGRFGLNIVSGTIPADYAMFGIPFGDHDARYDYTEEWVAVAKRIWTESVPFDHAGRYFTLTAVLAKPKPYGGKVPMLISAGHSKRGREFAVRNTDALFTSISNLDDIGAEVRVARAARSDGATVPVYASGHLVCRPTRKEADEWYHHLVYDLGDPTGVDSVVADRTANRDIPYKSLQELRERIISGNGTFAVRGSYDEVAQTIKVLYDAGVNGIALAMVDYIGDFPALRDEVLPRLERMGLRLPVQ